MTQQELTVMLKQKRTFRSGLYRKLKAIQDELGSCSANTRKFDDLWYSRSHTIGEIEAKDTEIRNILQQLTPETILKLKV